MRIRASKDERAYFESLAGLHKNASVVSGGFWEFNGEKIESELDRLINTGQTIEDTWMLEGKACEHLYLSLLAGGEIPEDKYFSSFDDGENLWHLLTVISLWCDTSGPHVDTAPLMRHYLELAHYIVLSEGDKVPRPKSSLISYEFFERRFAALYVLIRLANCWNHMKQESGDTGKRINLPALPRTSDNLDFMQVVSKRINDIESGKTTLAKLSRENAAKLGLVGEKARLYSQRTAQAARRALKRLRRKA